MCSVYDHLNLSARSIPFLQYGCPALADGGVLKSDAINVLFCEQLFRRCLNGRKALDINLIRSDSPMLTWSN